MKAIVVHQYGGPDVLKYEEYPDPVAGTGEVLVRVSAASVNPADYKQRSGSMKEVFPINFPGIIGLDFSGTIVAVGPEVHGFAVGDQVFGMASHTYGELCVVLATSIAKIPFGVDVVDVAGTKSHYAQRRRFQRGGKCLDRLMRLASAQKDHAVRAADYVAPPNHGSNGVERGLIHGLDGDIETLLHVPTLLFCHQESCELGIFDPIELNGERKEGFRPGQRLEKGSQQQANERCSTL